MSYFNTGRTPPPEHELSPRGSSSHRPLPSVSDTEDMFTDGSTYQTHTPQRSSDQQSPQAIHSLSASDPHSLLSPPLLSEEGERYADAGGMLGQELSMNVPEWYNATVGSDGYDPLSQATPLWHQRTPSGQPLLSTAPEYLSSQEHTRRTIRRRYPTGGEGYDAPEWDMRWNAGVELPPGMTLSEERLASLAEIDSAKFSYVIFHFDMY